MGKHCQPMVLQPISRQTEAVRGDGTGELSLLAKPDTADATSTKFFKEGCAMCVSDCSRRHLVKMAGAAAFVLTNPALPALAETPKLSLEGGRLQLKRSADGKIIRPGERVLTGAGGAVLRSRDQLFYLDEGTDAEFDIDKDGRITAISVVTGGILS